MIQSAKQQHISKKNLHLFDKTQTPGKIGRGKNFFPIFKYLNKSWEKSQNFSTFGQ